MQTFTHEGTQYRALPENVAKYRAALEKPKKHKPVGLSPVRYSYPEFKAGMSTADYVAAFNRQFDGIRIKAAHECANYHEPAPMLDASAPEVVEEINPDYVAPIVASKPKAATAAQVKAALVSLLAAIDASDTEQIAKAAAAAKAIL